MTRLKSSFPWLAPLILGFVLRLPALDSRPIWYDEAFSLLLAERPLPQILQGTAADTMPPLYYVLLGAWQALASAIWQQRMLNVVLGVALVGLVFLLGRELYGRIAGGWAAGLAAISPLLVYHAQELRMYTFLTLSLAAYAYAFLRARRDGVGLRWVAWIGVVLAGTAALYSHNLAIFSIMALDVFLLLRREWQDLGRLVLAQLAMGLLFLPWLQFVPGQLQKIQDAFWTPQPAALELVQAIVAFHASLPLSAGGLALAVTASLLALVLTAYATLRRLPRGWREGLIGSLILFPPVMLFLASYLMRPVFVPRAFMLSLTAYLVLAGRVIAEVRPKSMGWIIAGAFAVSAALGLGAQSTHRTFPRSPFREAAAFLTSTASADDLILHSNKLSFFPMHVYAPDLPQEFLPDPPGSHNDTLARATQQALGLLSLTDFEGAVAQAGRVRYVVFQRELDEYAAAGEGLPPTMTWLLAAAGEPEPTAFNDLWIYDFDL